MATCRLLEANTQIHPIPASDPSSIEPIGSFATHLLLLLHFKKHCPDLHYLSLCYDQSKSVNGTAEMASKRRKLRSWEKERECVESRDYANSLWCLRERSSYPVLRRRRGRPLPCLRRKGSFLNPNDFCLILLPFDDFQSVTLILCYLFLLWSWWKSVFFKWFVDYSRSNHMTWLWFSLVNAFVSDFSVLLLSWVDFKSGFFSV